VATLFLKLGVIGFGGPAAHIALMREEVVRRRAWMSDAELLELIGATNLIPGPNSTELAIHLGARRAGWRGLVVAGLCFIGPAVVIVSAIAWLYERHGTDPAVLDLRYGLLPVVLAIVAHAVTVLGRAAITAVLPAVLAGAALAAYLLDVHELAILVIAGTTAALWAQRGRARGGGTLLSLLPLGLVGAAPGRSLGRLFLVFLEIGSVLYGSGYVLLAFLQRNLVDDLGWVSSEQLLDAVTVGQITPGPVFTTATFLGWQIDGPAGAVVATVGIFLPSFVLVALLGPIVRWMRARPAATAFLGGVTAASLGLMAGVLVELTDVALVDGLSIVVAAAALLALVRGALGTTWLVVAGAVIGVVHAAV
jgi:chromate transporter